MGAAARLCHARAHPHHGQVRHGSPTPALHAVLPPRCAWSAAAMHLLFVGHSPALCSPCWDPVRNLSAGVLQSANKPCPNQLTHNLPCCPGCREVFLEQGRPANRSALQRVVSLNPQKPQVGAAFH